ncbi:MAG: shikimate dehydrogenase [Candidatus Omnitrophica bacterium]|nr:shikimate dehydrogenase [Candidatus Omnitrophota bacterium]
MSQQKLIYGLIGYPINSSLSPRMHNAAFSYLKINAEYRLFEKKPQALGSFLSSLNEQKILGLNVTIPYKEKVVPFLNSLSEEAKLIGAVNTIIVSQGKLEGFNTDGEGFVKHLLEELRFELQNLSIAILGAGGASKAIAVMLSKKGAREISIYDIDNEKAKALVNHLKQTFNDIKFIQAGSVEELNIQDSGLLINATPVGMKEGDPCLVSENIIHKDLLVYDLIYNPSETKLLRVAKQKGARIANGLGMLLYQGASSFELWTNKKAPITIMRNALNEGVKEL